MNRLEDKMHLLQTKVNEIDLQIEALFIPTQGTFFGRQVFYAHELASKITDSGYLFLL